MFEDKCTGTAAFFYIFFPYEGIELEGLKFIWKFATYAGEACSFKLSYKKII